MRKLLLFMLMFSGMVVPVGTAVAGEATLTWQAPTMRCDGTPLTNLDSYVLSWSQNQLLVPAGQLSTQVTGLAPGVWYFTLSAVDTDGRRSDIVAVSKTVAPEEFVVAQEDVFTLVKRVDRLVLVRVGTVAVGTPCIADQSVNGHYAVPRAAVVWAGMTRPDIVVAACR